MTTTVTKVIAPADIDGFDPNFDRWSDDIQEELKRTFLAAWRNQFGAVTGRATELATQYALERSGELLSGGAHDVGAATIDRLRELVAQAVDNGLSPQELARGIRDDLAFGPDRAQLIATTETATALGAGQQQAAREMGQDQKSWVTSGDDTTCDDCAGNDSDGWIDIDDSFSDGSDDIPSHPGCRCDVIYQTSSLHEEEAAAPVTVKEARCPSCGGLEARNAANGVELRCRKSRCNTAWVVGAK